MSFEDGGPIVRERMRVYDLKQAAIKRNAPEWEKARKLWAFEAAVRAHCSGTATEEERSQIRKYIDAIKEVDSE